MKTYTPFSNFTAQGKTVHALMTMYAQFENRGGLRLELTPMVVFMAFSIESYLNSIGARKIDIWDELERNPWRSKVIILHKVAKKQLDWGSEPLQFAIEVFKIRDKLAHGKPERVLGKSYQDVREAAHLSVSDTLEPQWYKDINENWVLLAKERFRILMVYLGGLFDLHESDHLLMSTGGIIENE